MELQNLNWYLKQQSRDIELQILYKLVFEITEYRYIIIEPI